MLKIKKIRLALILLCALIIVIFIAFGNMHSAYLFWDYSNPETAILGTFLHGFEFLFVRIAPLLLIASIIGIAITYKKGECHEKV